MATFSKRLQKLLSSTNSITIQSLIDTFAEKSFAVLLLLLLAIPALPLPTGGVTHIFEIIAMLLSVELLAGRKNVWLPKKWLDKPLPKPLQSSALSRLIRIIHWFEKFSKPRFLATQKSWLYPKVIGLIVLMFTIFAFLAPPFSGLDTLPSLGVVILSLSLIFEDVLLGIVGVIVGSVGIGLVLILGRLAFKLP